MKDLTEMDGYEVDVESVEIRLLLEGLYRKFGFDFRHYAEASLVRRIHEMMQKHGCSTVSQLQDRILHGSIPLSALLPALTIPTSEMFRDPSFFRRLREQVVPVLATFPSINVWDAACSTGEELHSLLILFQEAGLLERTRVYATDLNPEALKAAQKGIYPASQVPLFTRNYNEAGGREGFSSYYTSRYGSVRMDPGLRNNVIFSQHNLVTDGPFIEAHLIVCRNVFIYFRKALQERVLRLFLSSLRYNGFLALGRQETVRFLRSGRHFADVVAEEKIYQKKSWGDSGSAVEASHA